MKLEDVAAEIRSILKDRPDVDALIGLADKLDPPKPCTIDQLEGWEVVWCKHGALAVGADGTVWAQPHLLDGVHVGGTLHPWPERLAAAAIPEGWSVMSSNLLEVGVHELLDPDDPGDPWVEEMMSTVQRQVEHLVVARKRSDA